MIGRAVAFNGVGLLALVLAVLLGAVVHADPRLELGAGTPAFGGAPGGGNPTPPIGLAPIPPTLGRGTAVRFTLQLMAPAPRFVVLRDTSGRLLHVTRVEGSALLVLPVPAGGAVLDVLGGSALGLGVMPGDRLRVFSD